ILYNIVQRKEDYVGTVFQTTPLNIQFRRALVGERWTAWLHLVRRLIDVQLSNQPDSTQWTLAKNGIFTVKSLYMDLINSGPISRSLHIWKIKVP
uniref:Reverse transcriptase zinc-binding domain-containing protein n=1 Tax=Aegilops tauschii subsp. strangulata TaxID=200361 RepID=A0A453AL30_AEGTS